MPDDKLHIRLASEADWPVLWPLLKTVFSAGATYAFDPNISEDDAREVWLSMPKACYVAFWGSELVGTYYLKANQPTLGAHVCNAGYIVSPHARGKGIARKLCQHSQTAALDLGFLAMQYNLVAASNESALHLWRSMEFEEIGRLPKAFKHKDLGLVDAFVFYKWLGDDPTTP